LATIIKDFCVRNRIAYMPTCNSYFCESYI